jgi:4-hydroxy-tetrahydrodipicolinate reductase
MDQFPGYRASLKEIHHTQKLDAPSGTAITLAEQIISELKRTRSWSLDRKNDPETIHIEAIREGEVKGIHAVTWESDLDSISLIHDAKSRDAFAVGALMAASFIRQKSGVFGMSDLLKI